MPKQNILLCVTGGIAAYKAIDLASRLYKEGYHVQTVLTESACKFISPINFSAITHNQVHTSLWQDDDPIPHISLADWADLIVVAPASANSIARAAHGMADNLLSSVLLAHTKPVLWVPAMNVHMYDNPVTQSNLLALKRQGHYVLEPATGLLACAYEGRGKYPPNEEVLYAIKCYTSYTQDLIGVKALVSAGATVEAIDPMRKITNNSSGKMGLALARALSLRGAEVQLVYGSVNQDVPYYLNEAIQATDVKSMRREMLYHSADNHWIFSCAAVSDYAPEKVSEQKIKKAGDLLLNLKRSPDILQELGQKRSSDQYLVGFAAETQDLLENALAKLQQKNLDLIIANDLANAGKDTNRILIIDKQGLVDTLEGDKYVLAHLILDCVKARAK